MKRRDFLKNTTSAVCSTVMAQILIECAKEEVNAKPAANFSIDLADPQYSDLKTVGGVVSVGGVYVVCTGQSTYIALSRVCTHQGCTINYNSTGKNFVCPCHGGTFNINGKNVSGPPPSPLAQYQVTVTGSTLTIA